jgi:transposase
MIIHPGFAGIDISKLHLDVFDGARNRPERHENTQATADALAQRFKDQETFVLFEATGRYDRLLRLAFDRHGVAYARVNPRRSRAFARATGRIAKTDAIDAEMLAAMAQSLKPPAHTTLSADLENLRDLHTRRDQLVAMRAQEKVRLEALANPGIRSSIERHICQLNDDIAVIDTQLRHRVADNDQMSAAHAALTSIPGVGSVTAQTLIAHLPELGSLSPQTAAALAGVAPFNVDSGSFRGQRKIMGGRKRVTRALYMASITAIRMPGRFKDHYAKLRAKGKPAKLALIAIARKILVIANAIIRDKNAFHTN